MIGHSVIIGVLSLIVIILKIKSYGNLVTRCLKKIIKYLCDCWLTDFGETPCHSRKFVEMILLTVRHISKDDKFPRYISSRST